MSGRHIFLIFLNRHPGLFHKDRCIILTWRLSSMMNESFRKDWSKMHQSTDTRNLSTFFFLKWNQLQYFQIPILILTGTYINYWFSVGFFLFFAWLKETELFDKSCLDRQIICLCTGIYLLFNLNCRSGIPSLWSVVVSNQLLLDRNVF